MKSWQNNFVASSLRTKPQSGNLLAVSIEICGSKIDGFGFDFYNRQKEKNFFEHPQSQKILQILRDEAEAERGTENRFNHAAFSSAMMIGNDCKGTSFVARKRKNKNLRSTMDKKFHSILFSCLHVGNFTYVWLLSIVSTTETYHFFHLICRIAELFPALPQRLIQPRHQHHRLFSL